MSRLFPAFTSEPEVRQWNDTGDGPWFNAAAGANPYVTEIAALNLSAVWACETLITDAIATLPVDVYSKSDGARTEVQPPRWVVSPNPWNNYIDFQTQRLLSLLGWGNAYTLLVRDGAGNVGEMWNLAPHCMDVRWEREVPHYYYRGTLVPSDAVQHIRGYVLPGSFLGMSVIAHAQATLGAATSADAASSSIFKNGIAPSGVLEVPAMPAETSKEAVQKLRDQFAAAHGGPAGAGKPMVLVGGTTWKQTMMSPADAQLLESRKWQTNEICRWFRVPPHEIQDITSNASQGGGNGIEAQSIGFAQKTLLPWTSRLEAADNELLQPGQYMKINLNAWVRSDLKTRLEASAIAINAGMATPNERRLLEDEPRIAGGDALHLPLNTTLLDKNTVIDPSTANTIGQLVRAGFEPESVLVALGVPAITHTGLVPVTVQGDAVATGEVDGGSF